MQYLIIGTIAAAVAWYLYTKFNEYNQILLRLKTKSDALETELVQVKKIMFAYNMGHSNAHLDYDTRSSVHERSHSTLTDDESDNSDNSVNSENSDNSDVQEKIENCSPAPGGLSNEELGSACVNTLSNEENKGMLSNMFNSATNRLTSAIKHRGSKTERSERSVVIDLDDESEYEVSVTKKEGENLEEIVIIEEVPVEEVPVEEVQGAPGEEPEKSGSDSDPDLGSDTDSESQEKKKKKKKNKNKNESETEMIKNPETGRMVSIHSKLGKKILKAQKKNKRK